jgi:hypothetical protein
LYYLCCSLKRVDFGLIRDDFYKFPGFYLAEEIIDIMPVRNFLILILILAFTVKSYSQQQTADIGVFVGGAIPITDLSKTYIGQSINFDYGGFYRYNFNSRYGLRINALYGTVGAAGDIPNWPNQIFSKKVIDLSAMFEVNYLDFLLGVEKWKFSPYVHYGLGLMFYPGEISPSIIIGTGAKYALSKSWGLGAEVSSRKLTTDGLDNLTDPYQLNANDAFHNNDWVIYFGGTVTYKFFWGKKPCPAYNSLN